MAQSAGNVYQFKITLKHIRPPVWRKIQVPGDWNFFQLHLAIQRAMGWSDYHLHEFNMIRPSTGGNVVIGKPEDFPGLEVIHENAAKIAEYFLTPKTKAQYIYDFGDNWEHQIVLEKILPADPKVQYPRCTGGRRACPPEDGGGPDECEELLDVIPNPDHSEHEFDPKTVFFGF